MQAQLVKQLRALTGSPIVHCKKALEECSNDMEKAQDWLRLKGVSQAHKKLHNTTGAGLVAGMLTAKAGFLLEVLCETDFVAKTELFQGFTREILSTWTGSALGFSQIGSLTMEKFNASVEESRLQTIAKTQENLIIRRGERYEMCEKSAVGLYLHNNVDAILGLSGCLLKITAKKPLDLHRDRVMELAHQLSMQVIAGKPLFLNKTDIPGEYIDKETATVQEQLDENMKAKPKHILEGIVKGKVEKSLDQVTLYEQIFMISEEGEEKQVKTVLKNLSKEISNDIHIESFATFACEKLSK